ncbi:MAG: siroheme synthase CysG [Gammaproteobacteria bacterium]|nr:siroheme synthase CysG [Gammaproteobacteria bacterium]
MTAPHVSMQFFPAFLRLDGRQCLIVGGGEVAARKARLLLRAGAVLTVIAPHLGSSLEQLVASAEIRWEPREFDDSDVLGHWLVISATGVPEIERRIASAAAAAGVFCNSVDNLPDCSFITPAVIDRSPVVVAVSSGGVAPVLARQLRSRIEMLLPAGLGKLADVAGKWRRLVRQRITDFAGRRLFWERFFDTAAAGDADPSQTIAAMLEGGGSPVGTVWLVGAGPGDPGLLTIRALQCMQAADVVVHDRLVSLEVLELARRDAELISVGKKPGCTAHTQEEINALLIRLVSSGKRVCRLKGGDPYIFGRGGEEAQALADAGLPYRVVPGITAASGCAAAAGIPLTHRDAAQSVVFLTAHGKDSVDRLDWPSLARDRQTLAFYMGVRRFQDIMNKLVEHGRAVDTPIAIVERGTSTEQRVLRGTLGQLTMIAEANRIVSPAMLFIGDVARLGAGRYSGNACGQKSGPGASDADAEVNREAEPAARDSAGV